MNRYFYDLHIHSCLSPCGDDDMTPGNIAGMAALKGLQIAALTDHNTSRNCPAFLACCKKNGIVGIAGMELTTAEDIHMLCLFEELDAALAFSDEVDRRRYKIPNRPEIFGNQHILDENDEIIGNEEHLLINATSLSLADATALARSHGAFICPAHIDKASNGILEILGDFPTYPVFTALEIADRSKTDALCETYELIRKPLKIFDSDAHYLWDINEAENFLEFDDEPYSGDRIRKELFKRLKGETA